MLLKKVMLTLCYSFNLKQKVRILILKNGAWKCTRSRTIRVLQPDGWPTYYWEPIKEHLKKKTVKKKPAKKK